MVAVYLFTGKNSFKSPTTTFIFRDTYSLTSHYPQSRVMKHSGNISAFIRQRNDDLMRVFYDRLGLASFIVMPEIFRQVAESPARRFWVSEERASIIIARMLAGKPLPGMRQTKLEMFNEIYRRVVAMREEYPCKPLHELVSIVIHQPAPRFYMTPRTVGDIVYRVRNGWYDRQYARYRIDTEGK